MDHVSVHPFVKIGNNNFFWSNSVVAHHSSIEDNCWVASGVTISGVTTIKSNAFLGVNATIGHQIIMKRTKGLIINISSISAKGNEGQSAYSAAKAGVESMTKVWAKELGRYGIRSVAIAPGFMDTDSTHTALSEQILEDVKEEILLKKLGDPHDIAKTITSVIENDFINSTVIDVDGGMCM